MSYLNNKNVKGLLVLGTALVLGACESEVDKIVEQIDANNSANITYVNALDETTTVYLKSSVYNASVFDSKFRISELMPGESTAAIEHKWINGAKQSAFATENSITAESQVQYNFDLKDDVSYWAIAWDNMSENLISVFEKSISDSPDVYNVRLFANDELPVKLTNTDQVLGTTETGVVSTSYSVEGCSELMVGNNEIDLCQIGTVGKSYLVILDQKGTILVQE